MRGAHDVGRAYSRTVPDLDLRLVRYFTAVAEHGHFGRAAAALHLAQPSLSRQIQRLEAEVGVRLLDRTPQGAHPTAAGEVFLAQGRALLRAAERAAASARSAARPGRITVGWTGDLIVTPAVREVRHRHPDAEVASLHLGWDDERPALLDHRVDAVVSRAPFPTDGLDVTVLHEEPRVLVVPLSHRLAGKESVTLDDIADEPLVRFPDPDFNAFWRIDPRPDGRPAPDGPVVAALEDKFELIADGQAVSIVPGGGRRHSLRPDLTTVPVEGIGPCQVVLATRADERGALVAAFRTAARDLLTGATRG